jgi:hypothetical protein
LAGTIGETMARSLRISNAKLKNTGRWVPGYRTMVDGVTNAVRTP